MCILTWGGGLNRDGKELVETELIRQGIITQCSDRNSLLFPSRAVTTNRHLSFGVAGKIRSILTPSCSESGQFHPADKIYQSEFLFLREIISIHLSLYICCF